MYLGLYESSFTFIEKGRPNKYCLWEVNLISYKYVFSLMGQDVNLSLKCCLCFHLFLWRTEDNFPIWFRSSFKYISKYCKGTKLSTNTKNILWKTKKGVWKISQISKRTRFSFKTSFFSFQQNLWKIVIIKYLLKFFSVKMYGFGERFKGRLHNFPQTMGEFQGSD